MRTLNDRISIFNTSHQWKSIFVILIVSILLGGCGSSINKDVIGSWYRENCDTPSFVLYEDGTCEIDGEYGQGTWKIVDDDELVLSNYYGETQSATIKSIKSGCLVLESDGYETTFYSLPKNVKENNKEQEETNNTEDQQSDNNTNETKEDLPTNINSRTISDNYSLTTDIKDYLYSWTSEYGGDLEEQLADKLGSSVELSETEDSYVICDGAVEFYGAMNNSGYFVWVTKPVENFEIYGTSVGMSKAEAIQQLKDQGLKELSDDESDTFSSDFDVYYIVLDGDETVSKITYVRCK